MYEAWKAWMSVCESISVLFCICFSVHDHHAVTSLSFDDTEACDAIVIILFSISQ